MIHLKNSLLLLLGQKYEAEAKSWETKAKSCKAKVEA
jgi:hypothetical protein